LASAELVEQNDSFTAYHLKSAPTIAPPNTQSVNFNNSVTLLGYEVSAAPAGETMPVTLYWRVVGVPRTEYLPFVHLEDRWGTRWSQANAFAYPTAQWQPGEVVVQRVELPVVAGAPPGYYKVRVGFFNPDSGDRLPVVDENGRYAGDSFIIESAPVKVGTPPHPLPQPPIVVGDEVQPGLELLGYQWGNTALTTGETIDVALWWLATKPQTPLTTRLELYKRDNTGRILGTTKPNHNTYPFESWETPQFLIDNLSLPLPDSVPDGEYRILLQMFDVNFEQPVGSIFGNEIKLLGYNLSPNIVGTNADGYVLDLIWQAQTTPATDYTVFVHVLNPDGTCCAWQQDAMPQQNTYPTNRWLPDEVVVDSYQIVLPEGAEPGAYLLEVGLYMAENGTRLQVQAANDKTSDVVYLAPIVIQ
jgi:hypothetical protein